MMLLSQPQLLDVGVKPFALLQTTKPNSDAQTQAAQKQLPDQDLHVQLYGSRVNLLQLHFDLDYNYHLYLNMVGKYTGTFYSHLVEQQNLERKVEVMVKVLLEV